MATRSKVYSGPFTVTWTTIEPQPDPAWDAYDIAIDILRMQGRVCPQEIRDLRKRQRIFRETQRRIEALLGTLAQAVEA